MNRGAATLLSILADGEFHSGQSLARQLGVTRAAIWKSVRQLQSFGLDIDAVHGKGYCLERPLELLSERNIVAGLSASARKQLPQITILFSTESTNSYLMQELADNPVQTRVVIAEHQSSGRGRRGNQWLSPLGSGLYLSVSWHFNRSLSDLALLSLYVGVAIVRALRHIGVRQAALKWPNDIFVDDKKLCGVLIEMKV